MCYYIPLSVSVLSSAVDVLLCCYALVCPSLVYAFGCICVAVISFRSSTLLKGAQRATGYPLQQLGRLVHDGVPVFVFVYFYACLACPSTLLPGFTFTRHTCTQCSQMHCALRRLCCKYHRSCRAFSNIDMYVCKCVCAVAVCSLVGCFPYLRSFASFQCYMDGLKCVLFSSRYLFDDWMGCLRRSSMGLRHTILGKTRAGLH